MRVMNWNLQWMNRWFLSDRNEPEIREDATVRRRVEAAAAVIDEYAPHVLTLQEGPSRRAELELFVHAHLGGAGRWRVVGPAGSGQQKLYVLVRTEEFDGFERSFPDDPFDLDTPWLADVDGDLVLDPYRFTREPLIVDLHWRGRRLHLVNLHLKSKYVHAGERLWRDDRASFIRAATLARRRISAEAFRLREYLSAVQAEDDPPEIIVCGDFNDGPGNDFFERHYLTHSLVAAVAGNPFRPQTMLRHAFVDRVHRNDNYTVVFDDFIDGVRDRRLLIDHILLSPTLHFGARAGGIVHSDAARTASDHAPQWVDIG